MTERKTVYKNSDGIRRTLITDDERPDIAIVRTEQVLDEILNGIVRDRERLAANDNRSSIAGRPHPGRSVRTHDP